MLAFAMSASQLSGKLSQLLLAALIGGAVGGVAVWLLLRPASRPLPAISADPSLTPDAGLEEEIAAYDSEPIDQRVRRLERQLALLQRRQVGLAKLARSGAGEGEGEGAGEVPAVPEGEQERAVFETAVRDVIKRAERERRASRQEQQEERVRRRVDYLAERLGLSEDQIDKLDALFIEQGNAFQALHHPPDGGVEPATRNEWRERMREIRDTTRAEIAKLLTEEQLAEYDKWQEEEHGERERGFGPPH